jgi:hypothetical protein
LGIVSIGENGDYANSIRTRLKFAYPHMIYNPRNVSGAISSMYDRGIDNIIVVGPRDVEKRQLVYNNKPMTVDEFVLSKYQEFNV